MDLTTIEPGTAKDVLNLFHGIPTKSMLMKLCEHGAIDPHRKATGTGSNRLFDWYNLIEIAIWRELHVQSFSIRHQWRFFRELRNQGLNQRRTFYSTDFIVIAVAATGLSDAGKPLSPLRREVWVRLFSRDELMEFLSKVDWFFGPREAVFKPAPKSIVVVNLAEIRRSMEDYFFGQHAKSNPGPSET